MVPGSSVVSTLGMSRGAAGSGTLTLDTRLRWRSRLGPHPDPLRGLRLLALADDRGRDHHLHVLELADGPGAANAHARADRPGQVLGAVVDVRGAYHHLRQGGLCADLDSRPPGQVGVRSGHAPVEAVAG